MTVPSKFHVTDFMVNYLCSRFQKKYQVCSMKVQSKHYVIQLEERSIKVPSKPIELAELKDDV